MSLSRRQFFRRFWKPGDAPSPERLARYGVLETYARTQLLPYDFTLTNEQEHELLAAIRSVLEQTPHDDLFSHAIRHRIEQVVEAKLAPWRGQIDSEGQAERLLEVRRAAPDYVSEFLSVQASPATIDLLKETFAVDDPAELETLLKKQIELWIDEVNDHLVQQYDVVSVKDLVFAQLRSWC